MIEWTLKKLIGTKNERELKKARLKVARINELEGRMKALQNEDFARETARMKQEIANGKPLDDLLFEAFALTREAASRVIGQRHYDVQLIGGMFLHEGCIAEMRTGEGKTLTATLPSYLNALSGRGVHVVTVNDYLARRDAEWMGRVYKFLGMTTGCVLHELSDKQRQDSYRSDITYGQNNEFGFDYLRDNMKFRLQDYVQRELNYAIVDEVDSILIDEARTPLIISGPTEDSTDKYYRVDQVIPGLVPDQDYTLDEKHRSVALTDDGIDKLQKRLSVGNLYDPGEIETLHHVEQALRAHTLYKRDKDYVVKDGEVQIVDEFTGRLMPGRRWSDGLHQAIEAKEGVKIENENQTLATVSFQNYFRMYSKLSGMTGTADTEAEEFAKIYNLDVRVIPTNRNAQRRDEQDVVYKTEREKFEAVAAQIEELNKAGQPVLVGTVSIAKSEVVSNFLKKRGVAHNVLNAKAHQREADIVAQAGRKGAVTISTNMAGRGTDILLGGNAEVMTKSEMGAPPEPPESVDGQPPDLTAYQAALADYEKRFEETKANNEQLTKREREEVMAAGGLFIIGTERHESRRVDNQLRGRAGRQGDPGASRFFLSLEDDLMRIFGSERIQMLMERLGMEEGEVIEHIWLSRAIEGAQKRVEGHNFDIRKNLLEYDDVMNQQRRTIYKLRRQVLASGAGVPLVEYEEDVKTRVKTRSERVISWADFREMVLDAVEDVVVSMTDTYAPTRSSDTWDIASLANSVKESLNLEMGFEGVGNRDELQEQIYAAAEKVFTAREQEFGEDFMRFLQYRYLATIDQLWKDHLLAMDHLRQGIGLRGYGQKDPKQEYKKEGYTGFMQMLDAIKTQFVSQMMRVQARSASSAAEETARIQRQLAQQQKKAVEGRADAEGKIEEATATPVAQREAAGAPKPVGRNEPCPCGSGRKYKKCHGANEANP
ncbi:preprotein translocase subunit SecA [Corallococcus sp. AB004]|uniref:preprotein translocase subunit SecA n=1 Tax=Corallococcus TaxID=83461 RepID=UPI000EA26C97|nr:MULTISPECIES: preprotein translocase subunit SecA [Corallococcus]RKI25497.1 preprotein translocase subunit SecA [Corallococcus sp. AB004]NPC75720.1 preprotein translocase subunit SecA [Corallococcus exiguus]NPD27683.1 preprotein translocase subunit SecA [Corallococcus exiguus]NRD48078.1 preprotein translocase subunit SecA [Corallococcus exiguus]RKI05347.1 preprotein translocase subunit SecA [Corallococcus sp. AB038B]